MKIFLKKAWVFIKEYWYIFVISILFIFAIILGKNKDITQLFNIINKERELAKKEREIIDLANKNIKKKIDENIEKHDEDLAKLKNEHSEKVKETKEQRKNREKEMVKHLRDNPEKTVKQIAEDMGWTYDA